MAEHNPAAPPTSPVAAAAFSEDASRSPAPDYTNSRRSTEPAPRPHPHRPRSTLGTDHSYRRRPSPDLPPRPHPRAAPPYPHAPDHHHRSSRRDPAPSRRHDPHPRSTPDRPSTPSAPPNDLPSPVAAHKRPRATSRHSPPRDPPRPATSPTPKRPRAASPEPPTSGTSSKPPSSTAPPPTPRTAVSLRRPPHDHHGAFGNWLLLRLERGGGAFRRVSDVLQDVVANFVYRGGRHGDPSQLEVLPPPFHPLLAQVSEEAAPVAAHFELTAEYAQPALQWLRDRRWLKGVTLRSSLRDEWVAPREAAERQATRAHARRLPMRDLVSQLVWPGSQLAVPALMKLYRSRYGEPLAADEAKARAALERLRPAVYVSNGSGREGAGATVVVRLVPSAVAAVRCTEWCPDMSWEGRCKDGWLCLYLHQQLRVVDEYLLEAKLPVFAEDDDL